MGNVDFEGILTEKHHYWRNLIILLIVAAIIGSYFLTNQLTTENEKAIMMEFAQESLINLYQPGSLEPEPIVNALGQEIYKAYWEHGSQHFAISLQYSDTGQPDLVISILISPRIENLESEITLAIVNSFFRTKADKLDCLEGSIGKACEKVWFEGENKRSIGIANIFNIKSDEEESVIYISKLSPNSRSMGEYL